MVIITVKYFVVEYSHLTEENQKLAARFNLSAYETKKNLSELLKEKACDNHTEHTTEIRLVADLNGVKKEFVNPCCVNFETHLYKLIG
jgi:hypothetical protein